MYRAIEYFEDLQDGRHAYNVGDIFPRKGKEVDSARILALLSNNNKRGRAVIEKVTVPAEPVAEDASEIMNAPIVEAEAIPEETPAEEPIKEAVPKKRSRRNK